MQLLQRQNFDYDGSVPEIQYFLSDFDSDTETKEKKLYFDKIKGLKWNFRKEFLTFIQQKLLLLALANLKFLTEFLNFQRLLGCSKFFSPFDSPVSTTGGAFFYLYKIVYLPKFPLYTIMNEYKSKGLNTSRGEHQLMSFLEFTKYKDSEFLSSYNNPNGQKFFKEAIPDGYGVSDKTCYFYQGCYTHKCVKHNLIKNLEACVTSNADFNEKLNRLLLNNPTEIEKIDIIWECEMDKFKLAHPNYQTFIDQTYINRPLQRLIPRESYKGGFHDTYYLNWSSEKCPNERLFFYDVNGLFSSVVIKNKLMTGKYTTLIGKTLNNLKIVNNQFFYSGNRVMGAIFLSILPPTNLLYPFLIYKGSNGVNYNTLCRKCAEKQTKTCTHHDTDRSFVGTYMINEIEYALSLNYSIVHIFECHVYVESDYILKDFVNFLVHCKTNATNCFEFLKTEDEKQAYCDRLNKQMNFSGPLSITPKSVQPNTAMRYFYKLAQNSFFGKFGQRQDLARNVYCSHQDEIETLISEGVQLNDAYTISDDICCINYQSNKLTLKPSLKTNVYLSAQITSYAREEIHRHVMTLVEHNIKVLKVNCDSILFALQNDQNCPLNTSHAVGDFKNEIAGRILNYFAIGSKNYIIIFKDPNGQICHINKISGLSLNSRPANDQNYQNFISKVLAQESASLKLKNKKQTIDWKNLSIETFAQNFTISNTFELRRTVKQINVLTVPFGYKEQ